MNLKRQKANQSPIEGEVWKDIFGFEGYYKVSNMGRVKSLKGTRGQERELIMKGGMAHGYKNIKLVINGKNTYFTVHKLVGMAFLPNPENKREINHKNGIKTDNRLENLERVTSSENTQHAYNNGLQKAPWWGNFGSNHPSSKLVLDTQTGIYYETRNEAADAKNIHKGNLSNMLNGKIKNKTSLIYV